MTFQGELVQEKAQRLKSKISLESERISEQTGWRVLDSSGGGGERQSTCLQFFAVISNS